IDRDRASGVSAQAYVRVLLTRRGRRLVRPLELRRDVGVRDRATREVRAGDRLDRDLRAAEAAFGDVEGVRVDRRRREHIGRKRADARSESVEGEIVLIA